MVFDEQSSSSKDGEKGVKFYASSSTLNIPHKRVICMEDIKDLKIAQKNDLIESASKMDLIPLKIFELAAASITRENTEENRTVVFSKELMFQVIGAKDSDTDKHYRLRNQLNDLRRKADFEITVADERTGKEKHVGLHAISMTEWSPYNDEVIVRFTDDIMPYLIDLKNNGYFTEYLLEDIASLNSKHSITLYKWLLMNFNHYRNIKNDPKRTTEYKEKLKNPIITIKELRKITDTKKAYERFTNFEQWVLKEPIKDINDNTNLIVKYQKIKKGRSINAIQFFIDEKPKAQVINEKVAPRLTKQEREAQNALLYAKAMSSKYTSVLVSSQTFLMGYQEMQDQDLMIDMLEKVYPIYEKIEQKFGEEQLIRHIDYMGKNRIKTTVHALPNWLAESAQTWIKAKYNRDSY